MTTKKTSRPARSVDGSGTYTDQSEAHIVSVHTTPARRTSDLNARTRRQLLRTVGVEADRVARLHDDQLADHLRDLQLEVDVEGDLTAALHPLGRPARASIEQDGFPSALHPDFVWTFTEED